jgi:ribosomal protein S18 acetylase RimI-like enzyme
LVENEFPPLDQIAAKTLFVHCMMTASPEREDAPYQRKGIGSRMVRTLMDWARQRGWNAVEAHAYADLPCVYSVTGQAGRAFWEKLGFHVIESGIEPAFAEGGYDEFVETLLEEAAERGIDADTAKTRYTMRLALT